MADVGGFTSQKETAASEASVVGLAHIGGACGHLRAAPGGRWRPPSRPSTAQSCGSDASERALWGSQCLHCCQRSLGRRLGSCRGRLRPCAKSCERFAARRQFVNAIPKVTDFFFWSDDMKKRLPPAKPRWSAWLTSGAFMAICEKLRKVCRQRTICQCNSGGHGLFFWSDDVKKNCRQRNPGGRLGSYRARVPGGARKRLSVMLSASGQDFLLPAKPRWSAWLMSGACTAICAKLRKVCRQTTICRAMT